MHKWGTPIATALAAGAVAVSALAGPITSGLKAGSHAPAFDVTDVSGPNKGRTLCYVWANGNRPVVLAFVKEDPVKSAGLVDSIQKLTEQHAEKGLRAFVVYTGGAQVKPAIERVAQKKKITIPVTFLPGDIPAQELRKYGINPQAKNTVMTYRRKTVTATFVNVDNKTFPSVAKAAAAMLQ
jgi:hypothetical protein